MKHPALSGLGEEGGGPGRSVDATLTVGVSMGNPCRCLTFVAMTTG